MKKLTKTKMKKMVNVMDAALKDLDDLLSWKSTRLYAIDTGTMICCGQKTLSCSVGLFG